MERGICPIAVFYFALKHALSLTFKNVIGQQRYQCYQILGHMTIRLAVGGFLYRWSIDTNPWVTLIGRKI